MSLIHEALKKAEQERSPETAKGLLPNPILNDRPPKTKTTPLLVVLLAVSLLFFVYMRFWKKSPDIPQPAVVAPQGSFKSLEDPAVLKKMALRLYEEGRLDGSLAAWEKLTLLLPTDSEVYNNMGLVLKKMGRRDEAYQAYSKALALKRDYPELLNNLGSFYLGEGERQKAKEHLQGAIALAPDYADPYFNLALAFEAEGNLKQAAAMWNRYLQLAPELDETMQKKIQERISRVTK